MTDETASHRRAMIVLVIGACVIGVGPILVRLSDVGPATAGFWRLIFAMPLLAFLAHRGADGVGPPNRIALFAGIAFALDLGFWHYGIAYTSVAKATVLSNLTPVVVTACAWIFLKQRPTRLFLLAVAIAVAGAWLMAISAGRGSLGLNPPLGDALSATTAIWYALYFIAISQARQTLAATRIMFWSSFAGAPLLLLAGVGLGEDLVPGSPVGWAACAGLGLMHVAGQGAIAWSLGKLPTATASVVVLIQPVVAAILGWLLFNEMFGAWQAAGAALALAGVILAQWSSTTRQAA